MNRREILRWMIHNLFIHPMMGILLVFAFFMPRGWRSYWIQLAEKIHDTW